MDIKWVIQRNMRGLAASGYLGGGAVYVRLLEDACLYNNFRVLVVPAGAVQVQ